MITDENSSNFFHWFADALQKLEAIEQSGFDAEEYVYLLPEKFNTEFSQATLTAYGVNYSVIKRNQKVWVENLLVIPRICPTGNYRPQLINNMRCRFRAFYKVPCKRRRLYITWSKAEKRTIINEGRLFPVLKKFDFEVVAMEGMSFEQQFKHVAESDMLISLHGAGLTHMIWMQKNSDIIEIRANNDSHNNCYFSLASDLGHLYYYILAKRTSDQVTQLSDFVVDVEAFDETIASVIAQNADGGHRC